VKLWAMRGTLRLLPAAELGLWLSALGTYTHYGQAWSETDVLADAVGRALDGRLLTREQLAVEVVHSTGEDSFGEHLRESWGSYPLGEEAVEVDFDGERAWVLASHQAEIARAKSPNTARLLPAFDPWVVGASRNSPQCWSRGTSLVSIAGMAGSLRWCS
jgi:hypothetical protein